jgi:hypothetical protein
MSTMVKRVAQALQQEMGTAPFDEPASSFALARAAIAAMRERTEEMLDAWIRAPGAIKAGYQAMIDAALEGDMSDCPGCEFAYLFLEVWPARQARNAAAVC